MSKYINGQHYSWADITIKLPGGLDIDIQSIEYGDEVEKELAYGLGSMPKGFGRGNYKPSCKLSMVRDDYNRFADWCKSRGKALYDVTLDKIVVCYAQEGEPTITDVISKATILKVDTKAAQNDKTLPVDMELLPMEIIRDGLQPTAR